jgi:hypothetical protein
MTKSSYLDALWPSPDALEMLLGRRPCQPSAASLIRPGELPVKPQHARFLPVGQFPIIRRIRT